MSYFADLTPYSYRQLADYVKRVHVGWLDGNHPFEHGDSLPGIVERIEELCKAPVRRTRGWQKCPFCQEYLITHALQGGRQMALGDAEIEVETPEVIYVSPTLILHYIVVHGYKPPDQFMNAVRSTCSE